MDNLLFIIFELDRGIPTLLTEQNNKFIKFLTINYCFRFGTINPQELGNNINFEKPVSRPVEQVSPI